MLHCACAGPASPTASAASARDGRISGMSTLPRSGSGSADGCWREQAGDGLAVLLGGNRDRARAHTLDLGEPVAGNPGSHRAIGTPQPQADRQRGPVRIQEESGRLVHAGKREGDGHAAAIERHGLDLGGGDLGVQRQIVDLEPHAIALVRAQAGEQEAAVAIGAAGLAIVEIDPDVGEAGQIDEPEGTVDAARDRHLAVDQGDAAIDAGAQGVVAVEALDGEVGRTNARLIAEAGLDAAVARAGLRGKPVVEPEIGGAAGLAEGAAGAVVAAALEQLDAGRAPRRRAGWCRGR